EVGRHALGRSGRSSYAFERSLDERPRGISHQSVVNFVLHRIDQFDVANPTLHLADHSGHTLVALASLSYRPLYRSSLSRPVGPVGAYLGEVVGKDIGGSAAVGAMNHDDGLIGKV